MEVYQMVDHSLTLDHTGKDYILKVKDLPEQERPREKLIEKGVNFLSVAELMSVVLNTGSKKESVINLSQRIIAEYGERSINQIKDPKKMAAELTISLNKACQIIACFELGRRFFENDNCERKTIRNAKQAYNYFKSMGELEKECLRGIYLNSQYQVIHDEVISIGNITSSLIHPREVFAPAIKHFAIGVIIAHNHPSGSLKATPSDIQVTEILVKSGQLLGIELLDHLIVTKNNYFSIVEGKK